MLVVGSDIPDRGVQADGVVLASDPGELGVERGRVGDAGQVRPVGPSSARRSSRCAPGITLSTALDGRGGERTVRVTHPFHPWRGREFVFVAARRAWGEDRVLFFDGDGVQRSLPRAWTDAADVDPFVALAGRRSPFRIEDLLALACLIDGRAGAQR